MARVMLVGSVEVRSLRRSRGARSIGAGAFVAAALACGPSSVEPAIALAQDGSDLISQEGDVEVLTFALVGTVGSGIGLANEPLDGRSRSGSVGLAGIGDGAPAFFFPRGCLTTSSDEVLRQVTYVFDQCSGPYGLRKLKGTVKARYASEAQKLVLHVSASEMRLGRATLTIEADATIVASGADRKVQWSARLSGQSARARAIERSITKNLSFATGQSCVWGGGKSTGQVAGVEVEVEYEDLKRCRGACPEPGGRIRVKDVHGAISLEITFDGTDVGMVTGNGKTSTVALVCAGPVQ